MYQINYWMDPLVTNTGTSTYKFIQILRILLSDSIECQTGRRVTHSVPRILQLVATRRMEWRQYETCTNLAQDYHQFQPVSSFGWLITSVMYIQI